jgi:WXG100 family type VII secretion target
VLVPIIERLEPLDETARKFMMVESNSQEMLNMMQSAMNQMVPKWEGIEEEGFFKDYREWIREMPKLIEQLASISSELRLFSDRFTSLLG